jgi:hypothetical protein
MNCNVGHLDIVNDLGMSVDRAYSELLKDKKDKSNRWNYRSGVDIEHEDLKSVIWTNSKKLRVTV